MRWLGLLLPIPFIVIGMLVWNGLRMEELTEELNTTITGNMYSKCGTDVSWQEASTLVAQKCISYKYFDFKFTGKLGCSSGGNSDGIYYICTNGIQ